MAQSDTKFKQDLNAPVGDDEAEKVLYQGRLRWPALRVYRESWRLLPNLPRVIGKFSALARNSG